MSRRRKSFIRFTPYINFDNGCYTFLPVEYFVNTTTVYTKQSSVYATI